MPYATTDDLRKWIGQDELRRVSDLDFGDVGAEDSNRIQQALAWGAARIDAVLASVYALPLKPCDPGPPPTWPPDLVRINCELARWYLFDKKRPDDTVEQGEASAMKDLRRYVERDEQGRLLALLVCADGALNATPLRATAAALVQATGRPCFQISNGSCCDPQDGCCPV